MKQEKFFGHVEVVVHVFWNLEFVGKFGLEIFLLVIEAQLLTW